MLLGLDLGTTNVKALVTIDSGGVVAQGSCPIQLFHVGDAGVEQDLEEIWTATLSAIREAVRGINPGDIRAIGVSSQGGAMQVLNPLGKPLGRVISWLDKRGRPHDNTLTVELGRNWFVQRVGHRCSGLAIGQLQRLRQESPCWLAPPNRIGFVGDSIVARLCGRAAHDGTSGGLTLLYNPARRVYDPDLLQRLSIRGDQLPDLISPQVAAGSVSVELARVTGLSAGIPVSAAVHDQYAAALGAGAVHSGTTMVGTGTAWVLLAISDQQQKPVCDNAFVCHHVIEGLHGQIVSLANGGSALGWALGLMGLGASTPAQIEQLLASAPAGSEGLSFWPFLTPGGAAGLLPGTKGRWSGLQLSHRPAHVARTVVEGLAFELKRHLLFLRRAGVPVKNLLMGGAAAAGRVTPQILADVTGLPVGCSGTGASSLLGAAILARGLIEPRKSLAALADDMVPRARQVRPGSDAALYAARFAEYLASLPLEQPGSEILRALKVRRAGRKARPARLRPEDAKSK
jgi:xylulokinase